MDVLWLTVCLGPLSPLAGAGCQDLVSNTPHWQPEPPSCHSHTKQSSRENNLAQKLSSPGPKPQTLKPKTKTKGPWAYTKILWASRVENSVQEGPNACLP